MYVIIFIATFAYIISQISKFRVSHDVLDQLIKETHVYSGIHEESYKQFYANIQLAREYMSYTFLQKALHHLNDIPLYMSPIDPDIQNEIAEIGQKIAVAFERTAMKEAMNKNKYFSPKYI